MAVPDERAFQVGVVVSPHPHARLHLQTLEVLPEVEAVHLCTLEGAAAGDLTAGLTRVRSTTSDLSALLGRPELDALLVCVRNDLCPAMLEAAISAGKPVLFEKPGARRASDLRRVADVARSRHVTVGGLLQWRGHPIIQEVRQAVQAGALGRVLAVEGRMVTSQVRYRDPSHWLFRQDTAGGGILSWVGSHYLDALCFLLDDRVTEVAAIAGRQNPEPIEVEDTAALALRFAGGAIGSFHAGYELAGSQPGYVRASYDTFLALRGTQGYARLPLSDGAAYTLFSEAPGWAGGGRRERRFELPPSQAYGGVAGAEFVSQFLRASRFGQPPLCPIGAVVHVLEVIEAALQSSETGRLVRVRAPEG
jgi:predicted dehydrogenase